MKPEIQNPIFAKKLILEHNGISTIVLGKIVMEDDRCFVFLSGGGDQYHISKLSNYQILPTKQIFRTVKK